MKNRLLKLEEKLSEQKKEVDSLVGKVEFITSSISEKENNIISLKNQREVVAKSIELLQFVEKATREQTKQQFETIVTDALKYVFQKDYSLALEFDKRGNLPSLKFNIKSPGKQEWLDPTETESGGIKNLCGLALRLVLIQIIQPKIDGPLLIDEKLLGISEEYIENALSFLKEINQRLKRQIIMVAHPKVFINAADNIINLR